MKDQGIYLSHITEAISDIEHYTQSGKEEFFANRMLQDAVIRKLEVIGEAARHMPVGIRRSRPEIPWREISRISDKMMHEYLGVNLELVWATVERDLPELKQAAMDLSAG